uniref:EF-hand domain-containing protein n=1 Tax=Glossina morsitans morsitans TaxID=37546 RepID=A0A1B0GCB6_GLOMM
MKEMEMCKTDEMMDEAKRKLKVATLRRRKPLRIDEFYLIYLFHSRYNKECTHNMLRKDNIQQEREHIPEHLQVPTDTRKMSEAELQFHYFKMYDSDNNNKLDGYELIKSLINWHGML